MRQSLHNGAWTYSAVRLRDRREQTASSEGRSSRGASSVPKSRLHAKERDSRRTRPPSRGDHDGAAATRWEVPGLAPRRGPERAISLLPTVTDNRFLGKCASGCGREIPRDIEERRVIDPRWRKAYPTLDLQGKLYHGRTFYVLL
jgi:hypothetical protein